MHLHNMLYRFCQQWWVQRVSNKRFLPYTVIPTTSLRSTEEVCKHVHVKNGENALSQRYFSKMLILCLCVTGSTFFITCINLLNTNSPSQWISCWYITCSMCESKTTGGNWLVEKGRCEFSGCCWPSTTEVCPFWLYTSALECRYRIDDILCT